MEPSWRGDDPTPPPSTSPTTPANIPPPPRAPSKRARELIFRYQGGQLAMLIIGLVFTGLGTIFCLAIGWGATADVALTLSHENAIGHVVSTRIDQNTRINGEHPTLIRFRYQAGGTELFAESSTRDPQRIDAAIVGAEVPIEVSSGHPDWARMAGTNFSMLGAWGSGLVIFPTIGLLLVFFAVRSNRREIRAYTEGRPIQAQVVFAGPDTTVRINGRNPLKVRWEFKVEGQSFDGSISALDPRLMEDLLKQTEVTVLYDPMDPSINTVWV